MNCLMSETSFGILAIEEVERREVREIACRVAVAVAS